MEAKDSAKGDKTASAIPPVQDVSEAPRAESWRSRLTWLVIGAVVAALATALVPVALDRWLHVPPSMNASAPSVVGPVCGTVGDGAASGHEQLQMWLRRSNASCWSTSVSDIREGDDFDVLMHYSNGLGRTAYDVTLTANLASGFELVGGTTLVANSSNPKGLLLDSDTLTEAVNIGNYDNHAGSWVKFTVRSTALVPSCSGASVRAISAKIDTAQRRDADWHAVVVVNPCY